MDEKKKQAIEEIAKVLIVKCGECHTCKYLDELHCADLLSAVELYNAGYRKESDTAREICDLILEHWEKKQFVECDWLRVAIAEKYGVDLGE